MNSSHEPNHQPNHKTKTELINWRRNKVIELKSQGYNQEEIAQILQVTPALISYDLRYLRDEAMTNISDYTTKQYPIWFKACLVGIEKSMRVCWDVALNSQDNKEKIIALEHYRQFYIDMLSMLGWRGYHALNSEVSKLGNGNGKVQHQHKEGEWIYPNPKQGEQFSPYIYHSPGPDS